MLKSSCVFDIRRTGKISNRFSIWPIQSVTKSRGLVMDVIGTTGFALFSIVVVYIGMKIDDKLQQRSESTNKGVPE